MTTAAGLPSPAERRISRTLAGIQADIDTLKAGQRASQLDYSTLLYPLVIRDPTTLEPTGTIGTADDGGVGVFPVGGPPPPQTSDPIVTPIMAGLNVEWDGRFVGDAPRPSNFGLVAVHVGPTQTFITDPSNMVGVLYEAGSIPVAPLTGPMWVRFVPKNTSTPPVEGPASNTVTGTPAQVVAQAVLQGIVDTVALADRAVANVKVALGAISTDLVAAEGLATQAIAGDAISSPKIQANAVIAGKVAADSIGANEIVANAIGTTELAAQAVNASKIAANTITANELAANSVTANAIAANAVTAGAINAGAVTAAKLEANLIMSTRIIAGSLTGTRAEMNGGGFEAWKGTIQTFDVDAATGNVMMLGAYKTAASGARVELNPGGTVPDEIRFYQDATQYGYINAEPGGSGTAAVVMRSQVSNSHRGSVGVYPGEAFAAYQHQVGTSEAAISLVTTAANIWGGNVNLDARQQFGAGRVNFSMRNSSNSPINNAQLRYDSNGAADAEARLFSDWRDLALSWSAAPTTVGLYVGNNAGVGRPITASAFPLASSGTIKRNIRAAALSEASTAVGALRGARVRQYHYIGERAPGEAPGPGRKFVDRRERRDERGRVVLNPDSGEPLFDEVTEDIPPDPERKPHIGFVAEELEAVLPEVVLDAPTIPGGKVIDTSSLLAVVVQAVQELAEDRQTRPASVPRDPTMPADGTFFERGGTLYYRNSVGIERRVA